MKNSGRVAVFGAQTESELPVAATRTVEALRHHGSDGASFEMFFYDEVVFEIRTGDVRVFIHRDGRNIDLREFETVFLRSPANEPVRAAIARYCDHYRIKVMNSENLKLPFTAKLVQYTVAAIEGIPVPDSFYCEDDKTRGDLAEVFFGDSTSDDYIIKSITGSNGAENEKFTGLNNTPSIKQGIIQRFIKNTFEYRLIVANNRTAIGYKKVNVGAATQNNIARGGVRRVVDSIPAAAVDMALHMARLANRDIAAVDIVFDETTLSHKFFEVNFSYGHPGFDIDSNLMKEYSLILMGALLGKSEHI